MNSNYQTCALRPNIALSEWDILSSLPVALVILNAAGRILWLNPFAEAMLGYGLIDSPWLEVIQKAFVPQPDDGHEVSLADGRRVHVAISSLDSLPGTLITLSDSTATRAYERAKENDKRLMAIGTMTAQLAHQIRTPLASAILYLEHLQYLPNLDERSIRWLHRVQECHASIEQQIADLLLFSRGSTIKPQWSDLDAWCQQLIARAEPYLQSPELSLRLNNQTVSPKALIHEESLLGAIFNLVMNALEAKATCIEVTLESREAGGLHLCIEDNGSGMPEEVKSQAFVPFFTSKAKGTGLGLAVVFAVVKAHSGRVSLNSTEGSGTQVNIYLPGEKGS